MKNPCENCLVKVMCCSTVCDDLQHYMDKLVDLKKFERENWVPTWIKKYEVRPKVLAFAETMGLIK
jgi:hypothetical protein